MAKTIRIINGRPGLVALWGTIFIAWGLLSLRIVAANNPQVEINSV